MLAPFMCIQKWRKSLYSQKIYTYSIPKKGLLIGGGVLTLPTILTLGRIFLGPLFLLCYMHYQAWGISFTTLPYLLLALLVVSETSDLLDGILARKKNQVTDMGKVLDPMADSIFRISVFLTFTQGVIQLPMILIFAFIYRDMVISTLRTICALRGVALAARVAGKIKAVIQAGTAFFIVLLLIPYSLEAISVEAVQKLSFYAVLLAALYTLGSAVEYIWVNRGYIKNALSRS